MPFIRKVGTKEIRDQAVTNAKIKDGTIDFTKKGTYVPVNKVGDTMTGDLRIIKEEPEIMVMDPTGVGSVALTTVPGGPNIIRAGDYPLKIETDTDDIVLDAPGNIRLRRACLSSLIADPPLTSGLLWFRSDLGRLRFSPNGVAVDEYVKRAGDTITGDIILLTGKTVDGVDLDIHDHTEGVRGVKIPYNGLDTIDAPVDGEVPTYNAAQNKLEWKPMAAVGITVYHQDTEPAIPADQIAIWHDTTTGAERWWLIFGTDGTVTGNKKVELS